MSFPPATEMFQFAGFASRTYGFSSGYRLRGGLPHSEIPGSTIARISPGLFAACHVLHRLSVPRHPPDALTSRLSATPNGKDHARDTSGHRQAYREVTKPVRCGKLLLTQKTLLRDPTGTRPAGHISLRAARGLPPRSHNSLLYDFPSTHALASPVGGCREGNLGSSCRVRLSPERRLSAFC